MTQSRKETYRLIAFDMDGTLLDSEKKIRTESLQAIADAVRQGKTAALSTGRSLPELEEYMEQLSDVRYTIGASGGFIRDNREKKTLFTSSIPQETALQLLERVHRTGLDVQFHLLCDKAYFSEKLLEDTAAYGMPGYQEMFNRVGVPAADMAACIRQEDCRIYKFNVYCRDTHQRDQIRYACADLPLTLAYAERTALEYSAPGTSKASGLIWLCRHLDIPVESTIVVGDSDNDLEILKTAGLAVAMGNANENVKKIAGAVVSDNDSPGCAEAIYRFLL